LCVLEVIGFAPLSACPSVFPDFMRFANDWGSVELDFLIFSQLTQGFQSKHHRIALSSRLHIWTNVSNVWLGF
jgi:hypothetical protein